MRTMGFILLLALLCGLGALLPGQKSTSSTESLADGANTEICRVSEDLDELLRDVPSTQPAGDTPPDATSTLATPPSFALPAKMVLSDATRLIGHVHTTDNQPLRLWSESQQRWRFLPLVTVLRLSAEVVEESLLPQWRWNATGEPEKVYTGKTIPYRRLEWTLELIDGSTVRGVIKGQSLVLTSETGRRTAILLHERMLGRPDQTLAQIPYLQTLAIRAPAK